MSPSEIVDELEDDLRVIAINFSHQAALSDCRRKVLLRHVNKYVRHLNIVFAQDECKCRNWRIRDKWRGSPSHAKRIEILRINLGAK